MAVVGTARQAALRAFLPVVVLASGAGHAALVRADDAPARGDTTRAEVQDRSTHAPTTPRFVPVVARGDAPDRSGGPSDASFAALAAGRDDAGHRTPARAAGRPDPMALASTGGLLLLGIVRRRRAGASTLRLRR